jgi:RNA polymerase sigma factor, sigma-70 family
VDETAIQDFLTMTYPRLVPAVALISGSRAAAEDAVLEALARAWERSERGESIESLPAWVTRVALNLAKNRLRRLNLERRAAHTFRADPAVLERTEDHIDIGRALAALPRRQREATVLHYLLDLSVRDVAHALGVSEGTVKTLLFRARKALASELDHEAKEVQDDAHR